MSHVDTIGAFIILSSLAILIVIMYSYPILVEENISSMNNADFSTTLLADLPILQPSNNLGPLYAPYSQFEADFIFAQVKTLINVIQTRAGNNTLCGVLTTGPGSVPNSLRYTITRVIPDYLVTSLAVYGGGYDSSGNIVEYCGGCTEFAIEIFDAPTPSSRYCIFTLQINRYQNGGGSVVIIASLLGLNNISAQVQNAQNGETLTTLSFQLTTMGLNPYYDYRGNALANGLNYGDSSDINNVVWMTPGLLLYGLKCANIADINVVLNKIGTGMTTTNVTTFRYELHNTFSSSSPTNLRVVGTLEKDGTIPVGGLSDPIGKVFEISSITIYTYGDLGNLYSTDFSPAVLAEMDIYFPDGSYLQYKPKAPIPGVYGWFYFPSSGTSGSYIYGTYLQVLQLAPVNLGPKTGTLLPIDAVGIMYDTPIYPTTNTNFGILNINPQAQAKDRLKNYASVRYNCLYLPSSLKTFQSLSWPTYLAFGLICLALIGLAILVWKKSEIILKKWIPIGKYSCQVLKYLIPSIILAWTLGILIASFAGGSSTDAFENFIQSAQYFLFSMGVILIGLFLILLIIILRYHSTIPMNLLACFFLLLFFIYVVSPFDSSTMQSSILQQNTLVFYVLGGLLLGCVAFVGFQALQNLYEEFIGRTEIPNEKRPSILVATAMFWVLGIFTVFFCILGANVIQSYVNCYGTSTNLTNIQNEVGDLTTNQPEGEYIYNQEITNVSPLQKTNCTISDPTGVGVLVSCIIFFAVLLFGMIGYISQKLYLFDTQIQNEKYHRKETKLPGETQEVIYFTIGFFVMAATSGLLALFVLNNDNKQRVDANTCNLLELAMEQVQLTQYVPSLEQQQAIQIQQDRFYAQGCENKTKSAIFYTVGILVALFFLLPLIRTLPATKLSKTTTTGYAFVFFAMIIVVGIVCFCYENRFATQNLVYQI